MNITQEEQLELLKSFPNVELSYVQQHHKKVQDAGYMITILDGQKCFAWFTHFKNQNVCIVMEITDKKQILSMKIVQCCFKSELCYGTIFYGTTFMKGIRFFSIEDILFYKGKPWSKNSFDYKLETLEYIFKREIQQVSYSRSHMVFGLPPLRKVIEKQEPKATLKPLENLTSIKKQEPHLPLRKIIEKPREIISQNKNDGFGSTFSKGGKGGKGGSERVFTVKPDIQNDIYHLYTDENGKSVFFDVAYIPDYKTSVFMNSLFRKIKENKNLDSLEESDDEDEFENNQIDKFVYLDRSYKMNCVFNHKFKKWVPIHLFKGVAVSK